MRLLVTCLVFCTALAAEWPSFRGKDAAGVATGPALPETWDIAKGTNIRWKTAIPGRGHSTPIVWGDRLFLTAAIPYGDVLPPRPSTAPGNHDNLPVTQRQRFVALAVSRASGEIVWQKTLREALPIEQGHYTGSLASSSPVTDGEHLFVMFGSFGLYCLDSDGNLVWQIDFGPMQSLHGHGEGSSPALYGDTLVVNWDHEGPSFVAALDKRTGRERWKVERNEVTSWATPIIVEHAGRPQVIISGTSRIQWPVRKMSTKNTSPLSVQRTSTIRWSHRLRLIRCGLPLVRKRPVLRRCQCPLGR